MPVSMFSSANSRNHSGMISRWNSTRERMQEDERKRSLSEMSEVDGTGLHERENWPLAASSGQERGVSPEAVQDEVDDRAVLRRSEDVASPVPDADWKDGDNGDDDEDDEAEEEDGVVSDIDEDDGDDGLGAEPTLGPGAREYLEQRRREQERLDVPPIPQTSEVSPVRQEEDEALHQTRSGVSDESSQSDEQEHNLRAATLPPPTPSPALDGSRSRHSADIRRQRELVQRFNPIDTPMYSHNDWPSPDISRPSVDETDEEDEIDEARDVAMPIPFADEAMRGSENSATPRPPSPTLPSQPQTPQMYNLPMTNGHGRPNSMMTGTPQRSSSRASSHFTTTHIPSNKDRVRYSWQSIQDEEPNRPRIHIIKLVSEVATASAGFPGGEAFGFSISPGGRRIAAYNSARLYVLQTAALPVGISQDYALKRRPIAVEIVDEGSCMAILADEHTINVYDLGHARLRRTKTLKTDFPTNCIALAPTGGLLAAAYEGGVEIFSLSTEALPTDRRAVRSQRMDRMCFSEDGSTLLGTTTRINVSSTVIVSVPVFPAAPNGIPTHEELKEAWCSELLHPSNIRSSSHATFMRENRASCNDRVFAWNGLADTFGVLNVSGMQYGSIDFPVVIAPPLSTCGGLGAAIHSCPAIDERGDTVAMIVNDRTIRLYIVPPKAGDDETTVEAHSIDHELDEGYGCPFSEVRWVYSSASLPAPLNNHTQVQGRLIVTSPGGVAEQGFGEEMVDDIEGGRIILFDFDPQFAGQPGQTFSLTLGKSPPQKLEEEQVNVAEEVALVRRRTVNQSKGRGLSQRPAILGRAATTFNGGSQNQQRQMRSARQSMMSINSLQSEAARSLPDLLESSENGDLVMEEPYVQGAPRSYASMQRAASNAQRHRFQTLEERSQERVSVDSSGNFLALPEYTEEPNAPLPSRFRAMAGLDAPPQPPPKPSIMTSQMNGGTGPSAASSGPATAPASTGETFSAEEAFRAANATYSGMSQQRQDAVAAAMQTDSPTGTMPMMPVRSDTFQSMRPMPRSLQRAYSNAMSPLGSGPPPSLIGDWENVSPVVPPGARQMQANGTHRSGTSMNGSVGAHSPSTVAEDEPWDAISPANTPQHASSPFSRAQQAAGHGNAQRYSTSMLIPVNEHAPIPNRAPSTASSYANSTYANSTYANSIRTASSSAGGVSTNRRMPPHMQAFRNAAAASAAASLFPPTQQSDQIPVRAPPASAGSAAHPIMAWHPPAPSIASMPPGSARGHSRKSSLAGRSAFASTEKAKKLGFFKKNRRQPFSPGGYTEDGNRLAGGGESMLETRSMVTWVTGREGKCSVM